MRTLVPLCLLLASGACSGPLGRREPDASPVAVFEQIHRDFDAYYGLFDVKGVDWDDAYERFHPRVDEAMSDADLYAVIVEMLAELDDAHVSLYPATNPELPTFSVDLVDGVYDEPPFDIDLVRARYLSRVGEPRGGITYGFVTDRIGYLHIGTFDGAVRDFEGPIGDALDALADADALVVDIRDNPGGYDPLAQYVAGRFADTRHLYMRVRKRTGPRHDDFSAPVEWFVEPSGGAQYTRPIVVLTSRATQSAGETFLLAMRVLPHVTQLGETSAGALSDNIMREAGNGWTYTISVGDYRDAEGVSFEGVGIAPAVESVGTDEAIRAGVDLVLDAAIDWLSRGPLN